MSTAPGPGLPVGLPESYTVERELTGGGMSRVFLARDEKLGRPIVIKVLTPELSAALSPDRFQREISVAARLRHPHIVPLLDAGASDGSVYYTMPYIAGESLRDRLRRGGPLPVEDAIRLALEVADALGYAHAEGIVHRDIKPENILLDSGHAVITDFGIARAVRQSETHALTRTGVAVGTPAYMSPEQFTDLEVDGRSDVYSLGCVLFEMLTGKTAASAGPFNTEAAGASMPTALKEVLRKAMATNRDERFASAAEFSAAVRAASGDAGWGRLSRSRRMAAYGVAVIALLALMGLGVFWPRGARLSPNPKPPGQRLLSVRYDDVPLRDVILDLGPKVEYNMIASKAAENVRITAKIDAVPWDVAFLAMLQSRGLTGEEDSTGIIRIRTLAEVDSIERSKPNVGATYALCRRSARTVADIIRPMVRGTVSVDTEMNMLTFTTHPDEVRKIMSVIKSQDIGPLSSKHPNPFCRPTPAGQPARGK